LQIENLEKLILVNKFWPNDPIFDCNVSKNMAKMIELEINFIDEFEEEFEGAFKHEEISNVHDQ
jgi:hypothetical protein